MIVRATLASSASDTDSSTACASSIPVVPTITAGMPRAVNSRMSAPHGTPASSTSRPSSSRRAPRTVADPGWSRRGLAGRERPALPHQLARRLAVVERAVDDGLQRRAGLVEVRADRHAEPALELDPVRHLARPVAAGDLADEQRVRQLELAHQRVRDGAR